MLPARVIINGRVNSGPGNIWSSGPLDTVGFARSVFVKTHKEILDFHDEVERIARMLCEELGLSPIEVITIQYGDDWTPFEAANGFSESLKEKRPKVSVERWRAFRPQAALELAGFRALHKYILTET